MSSFANKLFNTPFFQNKFVLYASLFAVLFSIVRHISTGNMNAVILMALIGLVTSYFSKNMIIILLTVFFTVFLLEMMGSKGVMEGMDNKNDDDDEDTDESKTKKKKDTETENMSDNSTEKESEETETKSEPRKKEKSSENKEGNSTLHSKKQPMKKNKQGMSSLSPASYDGQDHDDDNGENAHASKESNRIDYASTLEQAYDNIENIIGEEGVRGLTDQTKSLMNQQKELMNNMKDMGPLLNSAEKFMAQLTGNGGMKGITEMLKGFAKPGGNK